MLVWVGYRRSSGNLPVACIWKEFGKNLEGKMRPVFTNSFYYPSTFKKPSYLLWFVSQIESKLPYFYVPYGR